MELNMEEIEKADFKKVGTYDLIHYIQGSHMELIDDGSGKYVETCVFDCVQEANDRLIAEVKRLRRGISAVQSLIKESEGVYGLHLNGDPSPWGELLKGGRFEGWLIDFEEACDDGL